MGPGKKPPLHDFLLVGRGKQGQEDLGTAGVGDGCATSGIPHSELTAMCK